MAKIGIHVYVSGQVQGVAFRYTAIRQARSLGIAGWVKNLYDGRVELLLEGDEAAVRQMVNWCHQGPRAAYVTGVEEELVPYSGQYFSFDVRF